MPYLVRWSGRWRVCGLTIGGVGISLIFSLADVTQVGGLPGSYSRLLSPAGKIVTHHGGVRSGSVLSRCGSIGVLRWHIGRYLRGAWVLDRRTT